MIRSLSKRVAQAELLAQAASGTLQPTVYGIIDSVDKIDGELVPNILRCWKGTVGDMILNSLTWSIGDDVSVTSWTTSQPK